MTVVLPEFPIALVPTVLKYPILGIDALTQYTIKIIFWHLQINWLDKMGPYRPELKK